VNRWKSILSFEDTPNPNNPQSYVGWIMYWKTRDDHGYKFITRVVEDTSGVTLYGPTSRNSLNDVKLLLKNFTPQELNQLSTSFIRASDSENLLTIKSVEYVGFKNE